MKLKLSLCLAAAWLIGTMTVMAAIGTREVMKTGGLIIKEGQMADLDRGRLGSTGADIYFAAWKANNRHLVPRPNVLLGYIGQMRPDYNKCKRAARSTQSIKIELLVKNSSVCIKTNQGGIGYFRVAAPIGPSPGMLGISYKIWNDCPADVRGRRQVCCHVRPGSGYRRREWTTGCECKRRGGFTAHPRLCPR
jgi:hypothetical protein